MDIENKLSNAVEDPDEEAEIKRLLSIKKEYDKIRARNTYIMIGSSANIVQGIEDDAPEKNEPKDNEGEVNEPKDNLGENNEPKNNEGEVNEPKDNEDEDSKKKHSINNDEQNLSGSEHKSSANKGIIINSCS